MGGQVPSWCWDQQNAESPLTRRPLLKVRRGIEDAAPSRRTRPLAWRRSGPELKRLPVARAVARLGPLDRWGWGASQPCGWLFHVKQRWPFRLPCSSPRRTVSVALGTHGARGEFTSFHRFCGTSSAVSTPLDGDSARKRPTRDAGNAWPSPALLRAGRRLNQPPSQVGGCSESSGVGD
jgi:hypothetical protein